MSAPVHAPPHATPDAGGGTLVEHLLARGAATPDAVAYRVYDAARGAAAPALTWRAWADDARAVAAALVAGTAGTAGGGTSGAPAVGAGEVVAVLAGTRPCWPVADVGALMAGAVTAGVYPTALADGLREVLADCGARVLVVDARAQLDKVRAVWDALPALAAVVCVDEPEADDPRVLSWDAWLAAGRAALADARVRDAVSRRTRAAAPGDTAALIYTSGSTGAPKGACIPHACLVASAASVRDTLGLTDADTALSFLPFAHAAERVFGQATRVVCGMEAALVADAGDVWAAARAYGPTLFGGLPRYYEKAHDALVAAESRGENARAALAGLFGPRLRLATSGGAPLPRAAAGRLARAGLVVSGAYGQTEHLCVAMHRPDDTHDDFASVGRPMPGTAVCTAPDGELLVRRSALTFAGYWNRPEATRAAFTADGRWLRTGDLGALDAGGRLHVTGRLKEVLALSTGKKVAPLPIEARLAEHPAVAHALVVGEGRRFAAALLFVAGAGDAGDDGAGIGAHVDAVNATLPPHERVRRWRAVAAAPSVEGGELTPTHKLRRAAVEARHAAAIEAMYA